MSVSSVTGVTASMAAPTWSVAGGVQATVGAVRSTVSVRSTWTAAVKPALVASTVTLRSPSAM